MENESYSIDDILSEVKKRREENELAIKNKEEAEKKPETTFEENDGVDEGSPKMSADEEQPLETNENQFSETEGSQFSGTTENQFTEMTGSRFSEATDNQFPESADNQASEQEENADEQMVDLISLAQINDNASNDVHSVDGEQENATDKNLQKKKTKKSKAVKTIIIVLAVLVVASGAFAFLYANNLLDKVTSNDAEDPYEKVTYYQGMDFLQENFPTIDELSASEITNYKEYLKWWYLNGDPVSSTHVLNVLLIGEDTREEQISDASRADSAIIASVNVDTKEIYLTSILRDMYVYCEVDGEGYYSKITDVAGRFGMKAYINTLERFYKISIDNYAVVNFASFPKIIDALGGVDIKITSAEINEINNHPKRYGGVTITQQFTGNEGTQKLNGKQALAYCRIRYIDSDGARANRQKTVLNVLFKKMKSSGTIDIVKTVNQLASYVYTGYDKKEIISIGNTAIKDGWMNYEVKSANVPATENCAGGRKFSAAPGNWIWLVDFPKDAKELQTQIYGKSNINLNENRSDYIALGR